MPSYLIHGLRLDSNFPIDSLPPAPTGFGRKDVEVTLGSLPDRVRDASASTDWYQSLARDAAGVPRQRIRLVEGTGDLWVRYADGTEFVIDARGTSVFAAWPPRFTMEDAVIYLLGPVLGLVLRIKGRTCLHASVVVAGGRALAFAGPAGFGKSTIAGAFARAGHPVLSDDLLALTERGGRFWAEPGYSRVRLWPESVEGLFGSADACPLLVRGWDKRYLDLAASGAFCERPLRLAAIYAIGERTNEPPEAVIESLPRREALLRLIANAYTGHLPGAHRRRDEFEVFGRLAADVPTRLVRPGDWDSLKRLPDMVLEDLAGLADRPTA